MPHIPSLSEDVYVVLSLYVGTPKEVKIRREVMDTEDAIWRPVWNMRGMDMLCTGSRREGFRLKTSDLDMLICFPDHKVICDLAQLSLYRKPQHTVILMECEDLPPGYAKLKMMSPSENEIVESSCVTIDNGKYISSSLYRAQQLCFLQSMGNISRGSFQHGPCSTLSVFGNDIDHVSSFRSHHLPNVVLP